MTVDASLPLRCPTIGQGRPLVLLHGFAMKPETYLPLAQLLAPQVRVVIPAIFELEGPWTYHRVLAKVRATIDDLGIERFSLLGHSFGGGLELGLATSVPDRVVECVFADTLGCKERFGLAEEALRHPARILAMASPAAASAFFRSVLGHPAQLAAAALWGFASDREPYIDRIAALRIPCHVMWASRDSLLSRSDGEEFARKLRATFTVASAPKIDHDWMFDDPELFADRLRMLGLGVFSD
jgi:pimeloyl-ACP methyl ester carboxylesterase